MNGSSTAQRHNEKEKATKVVEIAHLQTTMVRICRRRQRQKRSV